MFWSIDGELSHIIVDINGNDWSMNAQTLYVAASRAKHLLAICAHKDAKIEEILTI